MFVNLGPLAEVRAVKRVQWNDLSGARDDGRSQRHA